MDQVGDFLVLSPDTPEVGLVVEVKTDLHDRTFAEAQLKRYMVGSGCAVALLVTSSKAWLYRDTHADDAEESIETVGEYDTSSLLNVDRVPASGRELERAVFDWLERMSASWSAALPSSTREKAAVIEHIVPVVSEGRVVYGHAA